MSEPMTNLPFTPQPPMEVTKLSLDTKEGMEALQRAGNMLSASTLVPVAYRRWTEDKEGNRKDNPSGLANCVVALNMASRLGADPLMVMQNLHVIEGRPSWSSAFVIASINQCGRFSPLRFDITEPGEEQDVEFTYVEWVDAPGGRRKPEDRKGKIKVRDQSCRAWAIEKATGQRLDGPLVSMKMAVAEGWVQKKGSKWRTMQEVMLRYRSASLFGRLYSPELLMGLHSREEMEDVMDIEVVEPAKPTLPARSGSERVPTVGAGWDFQTLDELEGLLERASKIFEDAGFKEQFSAFDAQWRNRKKDPPDVVLTALRTALEEMEGPASATQDLTS